MHAGACAGALLLNAFLVPAAHAQTPFVDGPFVVRNMDDDPDIQIVREQYDAEKRMQSIYLRFYDGTQDYEVVSGLLSFSGAEIVSVIHDNVSLKETDAVWGIPGVAYGQGRGLEGDDLANFIPEEGAMLDLIQVREFGASAGDVRFWFSCTDDIDDVRIIIRYPAENISSNLDLVLYHRRGPDEEGYPFSTQEGIRVGSNDDVAPDDGDYGEVFSIEDIKLKIEDFDILEERVELGSVNFRGGSVGPGRFTIDNSFLLEDPDNDNGTDQNGEISPIRAIGDINHLEYELRPLRGPDDAVIDVAAIQISALPQVRFGERVENRISVDVPGNMPEGEYVGTITLWEDNNGDEEANFLEPIDSLEISVVVSDEVDGGNGDGGPEDAGVDGDVPDPDMEIPFMDMAIPVDMKIVDAEFEEDAGAGGEGGEGGAAGEAGTGGIAGSGGQGGEGGMAGAAGTGGTAGSGGEGGQSGMGGQAGSGGSAGQGGEMALDMMLDMTTDGATADAQVDATAWAPEYPGVPRGGALLCSSTPASSKLFLLLLLLLPVLRGRR